MVRPTQSVPMTIKAPNTPAVGGRGSTVLITANDAIRYSPMLSFTTITASVTTCASADLAPRDLGADIVF